MITVTKTYLPPIARYTFYLQSAYDKVWITNRGSLVLELEEKLKKYLAVKNLILMNNGTIPLQIAVKLLGKSGEIITTPFSYVATTASIVWENCKPIFADIHPTYLTIDETKIEEKITPNTTAILATHVFGNPCNIEMIDAIAKKYNLAVIYDAAHAFGVKYNQKSIFEYGTISSCSFHATKLFHTGEGGALFCNDDKLNHRAFYSHNFGHNGPEDFFGLGINGKISELQAAMGLAVFEDIDDIIQDRKRVVTYYQEHLNWNNLNQLEIRENTHWNYSYFPVIFKSEAVLLKIKEALNAETIYPRRYFYPSLNTLNYVSAEPMPVSDAISKKILCLPLYVGLEEKILNKIVNIINKNI